MYIYVYYIKDDKLKRLYQCIKEYAKTLRTKFEHISMFHFRLHGLLSSLISHF